MKFEKINIFMPLVLIYFCVVFGSFFCWYVCISLFLFVFCLFVFVVTVTIQLVSIFIIILFLTVCFVLFMLFL